MAREKVMKKRGLSFYSILLLLVIVPAVIISLVLGIVMNRVTSMESEDQLRRSMTSLITETGVAFDSMTGSSGDIATVNFEDIIEKLDHTQLLGFPSTYLYFVDTKGIVLYHPDSSKKGKMIQNDAVRGIVSSLEKGETLDKSGVIDYVYNGVKKTAAYFIDDDRYIAVLTADTSDATAVNREVTKVMASATVGMILAFAVLAIFLTRRIVKPLNKIVNITKELAYGNTLVETDVHTHVKECANLRDSAVNLKQALKDSIHSVRNSANNLSAAIVDVQSKTEKNTESINQISNAISEVAQTSQSVAGNVQDMTEQAVTLSSNLDVLKATIDHLQESSQVIDTNNESAVKQMKSVLDASNKSVKAVHEIMDKVTKTNNAIDAISNCVAVIEEISSQTNLLSLNASIEAARAGEAGRGFAVVAEEIRKLSDSTSESSQEIKKILENVVDLSEMTVTAAQNVADTARTEQENIVSTQEKFGELSLAVTDSMKQITQVRDMIDALTGVKDVLVETSENLGAISEQLGASAEEVSASCQTVTSSCIETQDKTKEMEKLDRQTLDAISFFKV